MAQNGTWAPVEADLDTILAEHPRPLFDLVEGRVPAFIMRGAYKPAHAAALVERFYQRGLLYDPRQREGVGRVDIGTSMGSHGGDSEKFFQHARETHELFSHLFEGYDDPVKFIYATLSALAVDKRVMVGREPDGRLYGPAIFRTYYEDRGHGPHTDILERDRLEGTPRSRYEIARFARQLSGVLCFQDAEADAERGQTFLYRRKWMPDMAAGWNKTFHQDAADQGIERVRVQLAPGDFYVFCSEYVHEVPFVRGETPRIVLASFFALSEDDDEIYVWS
jgi:hypothetical protein